MEPEPLTVRGLDGEPLTPRQVDQLVRDIHRRRVGCDVVAPAGAAVRVQVTTTFMVEYSFITAEKGGPWETLICELPGDAADGADPAELAALRWPDSDTARQAHPAVVEAVAGGTLYGMLARARDMVAAELAAPGTIDLEGVQWNCMVCGATRPDQFISVARRPLAGMEDQFPEARWHVRYCNDRAACTASAHAAGPWRPA